jgi:hypothetical protein
VCDNASHFHIARTSEILGRIGSAFGWPGWPGCFWAELAVPVAGLAAPGRRAATVQFCNEFPGSKYTLHLKVPKIAKFHALKLPIMEQKEAANSCTIYRKIKEH